MISMMAPRMASITVMRDRTASVVSPSRTVAAGTYVDALDMPVEFMMHSSEVVKLSWPALPALIDLTTMQPPFLSNPVAVTVFNADLQG
jgi:hypothetical protein